MYSLDDTIAAISTPVGEGGIGIVRMTGPNANSILHRLFVPGPGTEPSDLEPRKLHYGHIVDPATGERVDEVLAVCMPAPRTFTRQDVVEINGHGGIVALRRILAVCLRQGARLAEPGEFTARAFLNGRIDLAQAEAVLDVVQAKTDKALQAAVDQLSGRLSDQVRLIRATMVDVLAYLEASIDFVEDEIPEREIGSDLAQARERLSDLRANADRGIIYRQGVRAAIVGRPNVGKSSLLNRLLRTSRAIVTDIPGTTRDTLEETLNLQGVPVVLVDTAGITDAAADPIERLGIERSRAALARADLALLVVDVGQPLSDADRAIAGLVKDKPAIVVLNKIDLLQDVRRTARTVQKTMRTWSFDTSHWSFIPASALTGDGLEALEDAVVETVFSGQVMASGAPLVTSTRHREALDRALDHVEAAHAAYLDGVEPELVAIDVSAAVNALGEITGQTAGEDLVETIFGSFCVGK
ncbi:MAG: tRNA uridine-5-carboxymethylaminomethyl(34) synthesis GTPase MnmE [Anaerolineae bacterium]|jgi:tRNA modification GTPase